MGVSLSMYFLCGMLDLRKVKVGNVLIVGDSSYQRPGLSEKCQIPERPLIPPWVESYRIFT